MLLFFIFDLHFVVVSSFHFWSSFNFASFFWSSFVDVLHFVVLHSKFLFYAIPHPSWTIAGVFNILFYTFSPAHCRVIRDTFIFNHSVNVLAACATALSGHFLRTGVFYLTLLHWHFNLRLSRFLWEPTVLPWSLQGFTLILEPQT